MRKTRNICYFQRFLATLLALSLVLVPAAPARALRSEQKIEQQRTGLKELHQSLTGLEEGEMGARARVGQLLREGLERRAGGPPVQISCLCNMNEERSPVLEAFLRDFLISRKIEWVTVDSAGVVPWLLSGTGSTARPVSNRNRLLRHMRKMLKDRKIVEPLVAGKAKAVSLKLLQRSALILVTNRSQPLYLEAKIRQELQAGDPDLIRRRVNGLVAFFNGVMGLPSQPVEWGWVEPDKERQVRELMDRVVVFKDLFPDGNPMLKPSSGGVLVPSKFSGSLGNYLKGLRDLLDPVTRQIQEVDADRWVDSVFGAGEQKERMDAQARMAKILRRLVGEMEEQQHPRVVVVAPSIYRDPDFEFLPRFVEQYLGQVRDRIFFDPQDPEVRQRWLAGLNQPEQKFFVVMGRGEEHQSFRDFAEQNNLRNQVGLPIDSPTLAVMRSTPTRLVWAILFQAGFPYERLTAGEITQLEADITLLINA